MASTQRADTQTHPESNHGVDGEPKKDMTPSINKLRSLNNALPIHQLPIELLLSIFKYILQKETSALMYHHQICDLLGVCARWLFIIRHSPPLWTTVAGIIQEEGLKNVLERSSGRLIDVEYEPEDGDAWRFHEPHFVEFLEIVNPTTRRWRSLFIGTCFNSGDRPENFLQFPAPNLERLAFTNDQSWDMKDVELFGGNCPNLKHMHLGRAQFKWSQAVFKGLESLKLWEIAFQSVGPLLDIIRDLSQLKRLEICNCGVWREVPQSTQSVSLPNLQFLRAEFDSSDGLKCATEQCLIHTSALPQCPLYISFAGIYDEDDSMASTFCEWLFGKQAKEVFEGLECFKLGVDGPEDDPDCSVDFELLSGPTKIKAGIRGFETEDVQSVLGRIHDLFRQSHSSKTSTTLRLSGRGVDLLSNSHILTSLQDLPPVTHLELVDPVWPYQNSSNTEMPEGLALHSAVSFSAIKTLILWESSPASIQKIVFGVLGDPQGGEDLMPECRVEILDHVEIHIEEPDFSKVEGVVDVLRSDPRIGKVDLYVAL